MENHQTSQAGKQKHRQQSIHAKTPRHLNESGHVQAPLWRQAETTGNTAMVLSNTVPLPLGTVQKLYLGLEARPWPFAVEMVRDHIHLRMFVSSCWFLWHIDMNDFLVKLHYSNLACCMNTIMS